MNVLHATRASGPTPLLLHWKKATAWSHKNPSSWCTATDNAKAPRTFLLGPGGIRLNCRHLQSCSCPPLAGHTACLKHVAVPSSTHSINQSCGTPSCFTPASPLTHHQSGQSYYTNAVGVCPSRPACVQPTCMCWRVGLSAVEPCRSESAQ